MPFQHFASGIHTASVYTEGNLSRVFPGERHDETGGDVIAIKTHNSKINIKENSPDHYTRVILLIRQPIDVMKAEFTLIHTKGHTGTLKKLDVKSKSSLKASCAIEGLQ